MIKYPQVQSKSIKNQITARLWDKYIRYICDNDTVTVNTDVHVYCVLTCVNDNILLSELNIMLGSTYNKKDSALTL